MKALSIFTILFFSTMNILAQKQTFDVVSFSIPKGWQQQQFEGGVQLSFTDKKTGSYAIALITKAAASDASASDNFNTDWDKLIKGSVQASTEPAMLEPASDNGWEILSGTAHYTDGSQKGLATLMTATGGGQMASVVLMTNTDKYQDELLSFINSLELAKAPQKVAGNTISSTTQSSNSSSVVGMWVHYNTESSGTYNGFPQLTGGYMRREYVFYSDGSYLFRSKHWMVYVKDILFVYEAGTYTVHGNKLTLTPTKGKGEFWSKVPNNTKAWGKLVKPSSTYKPEKTTYTFEFRQVEGRQEMNISLKTSKPTERDGSSGETNVHEFIYNSRNVKESLIDNPPGFKTGFENKALSTSTSSQTNNTTTSGNSKTANSALADKIWEAKTLEKHGAAYGNSSGFHTGGFWKYQYKFNLDGSYQFVYSAASAIATNPVHVLQYETGTYAVIGNQIIITPLKGANEEWSVGKINNGMSAEHIRKVLETRIKRLKTTARKLEKLTYPFAVEYWQGNNANALCMKHTQNTVREGSPGQNDQSCFFETMPAKAENFNNLFN